MPQQHNPGRHVQSLTLPQSRHNHRNTSAYIFPTVSTPRTTPPTPGTASPRRRAPTLQLPVATRPLHSRHSPAAAQRFHRSDASEHPADTGPRLAAGHCPASPPVPNAPTPRRNAPAPFKAHPCRRTTVPPSRRLGQSRRHRNPPRAGHCLTSPPGPNAPTFRRNSPAPFKTLPHRRTTAPTPSRRLEPPRRHRDPPRAGHKKNPALRAGPIHLSVIFQ